MALIERARMDTMEAERLRTKRDDLLQAIEGLRMKRELARQEHANAQQ